MEGIICVDASYLEKSDSNLITSRICLDIDDFQFPDAKWNDFVVVILGWWLRETLSLLNGNQEEISCNFMDGPFVFKIKNTGETFLLKLFTDKDSDSIFESNINKEIYLESLLSSAQSVILKCENNNWSSDDIKELKYQIKLLKGTLKNIL